MPSISRLSAATQIVLPTFMMAMAASLPLHAADSDQAGEAQAPQEQLPQQARGYFIIGRVVAVDPENSSLVLTMDDPVQNVPSTRDQLLNEQQTITVRVPSDTTIILDDERTQLENLQAGDEVLVRNRSASRGQGEAMRQVRAYRLLKLPSFGDQEQQQDAPQGKEQADKQQKDRSQER
ncbi:MAG: hypothetical protein ACOCXA_05055 [Planctomycetota bacterium]